MRYLAVTVTAVLCVLMLHQTTGAAHKLPEDEQLVLAKLKILRGQLKSVRSAAPVAVQATNVGAAPKECYLCASVSIDGVFKYGNASCEDPFPDPPEAAVVKCETDGDFCEKAIIIDGSGGQTTRSVIRDCNRALEKLNYPCKNGEIRLSGTATMEGKSSSLTIIENCCSTNKCNGAPSISYSSKIFVSVIGLLVIFFYSYSP